MDCIGAFSFIIERKEDKHVSWGLFMSCEINYVFYKENTKFNELSSFYCVQCRLGGRTAFVRLINEIWEAERVLT